MKTNNKITNPTNVSPGNGLVQSLYNRRLNNHYKRRFWFLAWSVLGLTIGAMVLKGLLG